MLKQLRKLLAPPVFEDAEMNFIARNLNIILLSAFAGSAVTILRYLVLGKFSHGYTGFVLLAVGLIISFSLFLLHKRHLSVSSYLTVFTLTSLPFLLMIGAGGIHDTAIMILPVVIIVSSMLLPWRILGIHALLIAIFFGAVVRAEVTGNLVTAYSARTTNSDATDAFTILSVAALMSGLLATTLRRNLRRLDSALKEREISEERYRLISGLSSDYVFSSRVDSQGQITHNWESGAFKAISGYTPEEFRLLGGWRATLHPDDLGIDDQMLEKIRSGQKTVGELRVITKSGQVRWVRVYASPVWDEKDNRLTGIYGAVQNIDEKKRAESILEQRDSILEVVTHSAQNFLQGAHWRTSIDVVLGELGRVTDSSHVYIFENHILPDGVRVTSLKYEWAAPQAESDLENPRFQNLPLYEDGVGGWVNTLSSGEPYFGNLNSFTEAEYKHFTEIGIKAILDVPIFVKGEWWGEIGFDDMKNVRAWDQAEIDALMIAARMIGAAIEGEQSDESLRQKANQMQALNEIGLAVTTNLDLDQVLGDLFEKCRQLLPIDTFYIALFDDENHLIKHPLFFDGSQQTRVQVDDRDIRTAPGLSGHVIRAQKTIYLPDSSVPAVQEKYMIVPTGSMPSRSYVGVPMFSRERVVGVISMQKFEANAYSAEQIHFLETIATQAAAAIENARLFDQAQQRAERLATIVEIGHAVSTLQDLDAVLELIYQQVRRIASVDAFFVGLWDKDKNRLTFPLTYDLGVRFEQPDTLLTPDLRISDVIQTGKPVCFHRTPEETAELEKSFGNVGNPKHRSKSLLYVPLWQAHKVFGVLSVQSYSYNAYPEELVEMVAAIGDQAAIAIQNARLFMSIQHELAEREKTQLELEASNRELESLSYNIAHDMRSPVRALEGYSSLLKQGQGANLDEEGRSDLERINASAKRLGQLIDGFLEYLRLGRAIVNRQDIGMEEFLRVMTDQVLSDNPGRNIQISIGYLPPCQADAGMLGKVWINLLSNAVKFTHLREVARIEIGSLEQDGKTCYFIRDNGIGFDMKYAEKIFVLFQHLNNLEEYEGNGVGLAIVQRIVHNHGGRVWAESEPHKGATFYFSL